MLSFLKRKNRWASTLKTQTVEYEGIQYQLREMTTAEVQAFMTQLSEEGEQGAGIACAWMLTKTCAQFKNEKPEELLVFCGTQCLEFLTEKALELSRIGEQYAKEDEKKS